MKDFYLANHIEQNSTILTHFIKELKQNIINVYTKKYYEQKLQLFFGNKKFINYFLAFQYPENYECLRG